MGNYSILAHGFLVFIQYPPLPKGRFFLAAGAICLIFRNSPLLAFAFGPNIGGLVWVSYDFIRLLVASYGVVAPHCFPSFGFI